MISAAAPVTLSEQKFTMIPSLSFAASNALTFDWTACAL